MIAVCHAHRFSRAIEFDLAGLPLFSWFAKPARKGGRPARATLPAKHCRDCGAPINRSSRERCKPCSDKAQRRSCPGDFLAILRKLGSQGAAAHYRASLATVTRWRRELELRPQARMKKGIGQSRPQGFVARPLLINRDTSMAGQAADFLRRFGAVYRCDEAGPPNPKGKFWKRNFVVLTDDELVARAKRLGWMGWEL